ncbi:MAG: acetyl-CoA carboxylase biotin carboxyl carrier protein [Eubacteriaceae bacterium]|nr:acetyl-CoA carboxylase biotin carboxyl carrier protein [Eubacteriaceae bacterium]MCR4893915.1 acetyl-CoA carboxylase biotin carboxyl carrier protein [Eubacteriales bacterium]
MIELEKIEGLVKILEASSLTEMTVRDGEFKITMSKLDNPPVVAAGAAVAPAPAAVSVSAEVKEEKPAEDDIEYIISPIVGTFYSAPAPDAAPFVRIGDHVKNGQTVCILEAMKLMNEIQTEFDCEIEAVLVSNEQKVEYGQPLFKVKKL